MRDALHPPGAHGMWSFPIKIDLRMFQTIGLSLVAAASIAPKIGIVWIFNILAFIPILLILSPTAKRRYLSIAFTIAILGLLVSEWIPFEVCIILFALLLFVTDSSARGLSGLVVISLAMHFSVFDTASAIMSSWLQENNTLAIAAPIISLAAVYGIFFPKNLPVILLMALSAFGIAAIFLTIEISNYLIAQIVCWLFTVLFSFVIFKSQETSVRPAPLIALLAMLVLSWAGNSPSSGKEVYFSTPTDAAAYEHQFFENYQEVLSAAGIEAQPYHGDIKEISHNSILILPWLTADLPFNLEDIPSNRGLTIILGAEHTNMGGVADRINTSLGRRYLNNDLTVPYKNTDVGGYLTTSGLVSWGYSKAINRGASVSVHSLRDKVILSADSWTFEPFYKEWLWLGDYILSDDDKVGRTSIAVSTVFEGNRFVIFGDNTPFINRQIIAQPEAIRTIISLASLQPTALLDFFILAGIIIVLCFTRPIILVALLSLLLLIATLLFKGRAELAEAKNWNLRGETGYSYTNFNEQLSKYPLLFSSGYRITRSDIIDAKILDSKDNQIVFGFLDRDVMNKMGVQDCKRIGGIETIQQVRVMNAQACLVKKEFKVHLGDHNSAVIFSFVNSNGATIVIVLDSHFLANSAPVENGKFLLQELETLKKI